MVSGMSHKTKVINSLKTELLFSCAVVFSVGQKEGIPIWTASVNLNLTLTLTKQQFMLEQKHWTKLTSVVYQESFPQML